MKRIAIIFTSLLVILSLFGCKSKSQDIPTPSPLPDPTEAVTTDSPDTGWTHHPDPHHSDGHHHG